MTIKLRGVSELWKETYKQILEENLIAYFQWGFLEVGGFTNVTVSDPGNDDPYAEETLYYVSHPNYTDGQVWQSKNTDWVYESGLTYLPAPTLCSGVYIDGVYYPNTTTGQYAHYVDFIHGRIYFNNAIPTSSIVQAEYSYRHISIFDQDVSWFRPVVLDGFLTEEQDGGVEKLLDDLSVQPPMIVVESTMNTILGGRGLGSPVWNANQDVLFHIIAETKEERDRIADIITFQKNQTFWLYDTNARRMAGDFNFLANGKLKSGAKSYPQLIQSYPLTKAEFLNTRGSDINLKLPLFRGVVRATLECVISGV